MFTDSKATKRAWTSDGGLLSAGPCGCGGAVPECLGAEDAWWGRRKEGGEGEEGSRGEGGQGGGRMEGVSGQGVALLCFSGEVRAKGANLHEVSSSVSEDTPLENIPFDFPDPPLPWRRFSEGMSSRRSSQPQSILSASTITPMDVGGTAPCTLTASDLMEALKGYVPSALRGVTLQKAGGIGFPDVGGLHTAKETLTRVIFWPSKVCCLFVSSVCTRTVCVLVFPLLLMPTVPKSV